MVGQYGVQGRPQPSRPPTGMTGGHRHAKRNVKVQNVGVHGEEVVFGPFNLNSHRKRMALPPSLTVGQLT